MHACSGLLVQSESSFFILEVATKLHFKFQLHKEKTWNEYIMRKMEIAKHIGLDLQVCIHLAYPRNFL